jgi:4-hydroxybenzoyl-CoA reductase subunit beta
MLRLNDFDVVTPETVDEVIAALAEPGAMIVAGGTDLVPKLKRGQFEPSVLVSLSRLRGLDTITESSGRVTIGALTTLRAVERSDALAPFTAVREAVRQVATPIIRNNATLGGNLAQDTRCRYYDRGKFWREAVGYCLKKDGDECRVAPGGGRCFATFCSDIAPALAVHGARVTVTGIARRTLPLESIYRDDGIEYIDLEREMITSVEIDNKGLTSTYKKLRIRDGFDFPEVGVAAAIGGAGPLKLKAAVTGVGPRICVLEEETDEVGEVDEARVDDFVERVFKAVRPVDTMFFSPAYRKKMVRRLLRQAFNELLAAR